MTDWGLLDAGAADTTGTDDDAVLAAMVEVERALLRAWGSELDEFLDAQADALDAASHDRAALVEGVGRDAVPVVALVPALRAQLEAAGLSAERLHLGATSQDVLDTALVLVSRDALQPHVEAVRTGSVRRRHERSAAVGIDAGQQRIGGIGLRLVAEVRAGEQVRQHAAGEERHEQVRRRSVAHRTRLDRRERVVAVPVDRGTAEAGEAVLVAGERPSFDRGPPRGIRAPDLDDRVGYRVAGAIEDRAVQADRVGLPWRADIGSGRVRQGVPEERADGLRRRLAEWRVLLRHGRRPPVPSRSIWGR